MPHYLLSLIQPADPVPAPDKLERVMDDVAALNDDLRAAGAWVFTAGLHDPSTATVVRTRPGDPLLTDGPFAEGKEHVGGFWIVAADDLDAALAWGRRASEATTLPVEVRPVSQLIAEVSPPGRTPQANPRSDSP
jgi:hypothetical protein